MKKAPLRAGPFPNEFFVCIRNVELLENLISMVQCPLRTLHKYNSNTGEVVVLCTNFFSGKTTLLRSELFFVKLLHNLLRVRAEDF